CLFSSRRRHTRFSRDWSSDVCSSDLMEYGNYGYTDELTGARWTEWRINREDSVPRRHWHQDDPGVVPNLLVNGAGSPSGLCIYEGSLLPAGYQGQLIHAEAGQGAIRIYPVRAAGEGIQ